jgi:hypothetical protein
MKKFHFFVCRNGYGHLKRVYAVAKKLIQHTDCSEITIHCNKELVKYTQTWEDFQILKADSKTNFEYELMKDSPIYRKEDSFQNTLKWLELIQVNKKQIEGTIIIDNDIALLSQFPDAIVMGSFLWKDILQEKSHAEWIRFEKKLLAKYKPIHIGVGKMAMPSVQKNPHFMELPWFTEARTGRQSPIKERKSILVTGGGTGFYNEKLLNIAKVLKVKGEEVYVDGMLFAFSNGDFPLFSFQAIDFCNLKAIVCRPGMGILNDCVSFAIPIFAVEDNQNSELMHNAIRVEELGIGFKVSNAGEVTDGLKQKNKMELLHQNLLEQELNGAEMAAKYLISSNLER